ncbi:2,3-dihydroxybiphenyl 1,2-dioxygenase [Streptomyces sp. S3(2020)]|uniref:VOC family protein n=1 Tax=Streptomyces sp. S3(2020) TaxID=2732044 RepID=UPI001489CEC0|nr:VOC family protein [Streptomyces sp. S3(2020)]NNN29181.1 2,3-dihydroxybiphenyl 1,2-dioxygenase [Streptomyces sp. S3(2020)]
MGSLRDPHTDLHSEQGALRGEHPGRAQNPVVKVHDVAWVEFEKPDLERAELFARAFGFTVSLRTADELQLRGTDPGSPCVVIRRGPRSRFVGSAFRATDDRDVLRLAEATGRKAAKLPESLGGISVDLTDPSGFGVRVVSGTHELPPLPGQEPLEFNFGHDVTRVNAGQRAPRDPAKAQRIGHVVLQSTKFREALDWYLEHLGMIVSDFQYFPEQRERGPVMAFLRCDRGSTPADHHTVAMNLGPTNKYVHSAYQVADLDTLAAGGQYLLQHGYQRSWGIGRHIDGSQIFDYWRDPDGFLVEHFTDGDLFDCTLEPGWGVFAVSTLSQWGPPPSKDFLGVKPGRESLSELRAMAGALREDNEFDRHSLRGLLKAAAS